jgi:PAS domain-containing protein
VRPLLTSWKDVARYLGKTTRTVQRWEKQFGLPIHRPPNQRTGVILARCEEVEQWIQSCATSLPHNRRSARNFERSAAHIHPTISAHFTVLESIARGASCSETLGALARAIHQDLRCKFCSIVLLNRGQDRLVHVAGANVPKHFKRRIESLRVGPNPGYCGTAAFRGEIIVIADVWADAEWANHRELAREYGIRACWSAPILSRSKAVIGAFEVYYGERQLANADHIRTLKLAAYLAAITLQSKSPANTCHEVPRGNAGFFALDGNWTITAVNQEAIELLRRPQRALLGKNLWAVYPDALGSIFHSEYERAFTQNVTVAFEAFYEPLGSQFLVTAHPHESGLAVFFRRSERLFDSSTGA